MRGFDCLVDIVGDVLTEVGAAELMPRFRGVVANPVRQKTSAFDVVSEADLAAEQAISERLVARFPGAVIVGEERSAGWQDNIKELSDAPLVFLVDPLDGTKNFVSGMPLFAIMVAAVAHGKVVFGAIHDPVSESTAFTLRGDGAWITSRDGPSQRLRVSSETRPSHMEAVAGVNFLPADCKAAVLRNLPSLRLTYWLRCCAHEYRAASAGHCDLLVYNKLTPWDHAAGWLLHAEAGGFGAHVDGRGYDPFNPEGGLLCAPNVDGWHAARSALFDA